MEKSSKTNILLKYKFDYLLPIVVFFIIFYKNLSNIVLVDYNYPAFFDVQKNLILSDYSYIFSLMDIFKIIFYPFLNSLFSISVLLSMILSYFYIKRIFTNKPLLFVLLFSFVFFFNPFVYSRIMIGQLGVLIAYLLIPVSLYYSVEFMNKKNIKSIAKLSLSVTLCSLFAIHFFIINLMIFITAFFWFYSSSANKYNSNNKSSHPILKKIAVFIFSLASLIIFLILLNSFWLQGFFSNNPLSSIDSQHEQFFSPKMSENIPAIAKILSGYGFWREAAYKTAYNSLPLFIFYALLSVLIALFLYGYYKSDKNETKESNFFFTLFWLGLILATGISHPYTKPFFDFLFTYLPFFNGFRDSHKLVSLILLSYSYFIPTAILSIYSKLKIKIIKKQDISKTSIPAVKLIINNISSVLIITALLISLILISYPLIGLNSQIKSINYPNSYYETNNFIEQQNIQGNIIYLPWQSYLTYDWTKNSSSDGRISVPINRIIKQPVLIGADTYGSSDTKIKSINICLNQKSLQCLENLNIQFILKDKCAFFPENYSWIDGIAEKTFTSKCIDVYEIKDYKKLSSTIPLRFIIGIIISSLTFIILILFTFKKSRVK